MSIDWSALTTAALGAIGTWIAGGLIAWLTAAGQKIREQGVNFKSTLYISIVALGVSVGALLAALLLPRSLDSTSVIAGSWNGSTIDRVSWGARIKGSRAQNLVRISFESYSFKVPPIVLCDAPPGAGAYVSSITTDYVDIIVQTIENGALNGRYAPERPFSFQIIPSSKT